MAPLCPNLRQKANVALQHGWHALGGRCWRGRDALGCCGRLRGISGDFGGVSGGFGRRVALVFASGGWGRRSQTPILVSSGHALEREVAGRFGFYADKTTLSAEVYRKSMGLAGCCCLAGSRTAWGVATTCAFHSAIAACRTDRGRKVGRTRSDVGVTAGEGCLDSIHRYCGAGPARVRLTANGEIRGEGQR